MDKIKKLIQIKCVIKCEECGNQQSIMSLIEYSRHDFPNLSCKEFYNIADNDSEEFERIIKENLVSQCQKCNGTGEILEILDAKYIDNLRRKNNG